jgi:hypothetical protein
MLDGVCNPVRNVSGFKRFSVGLTWARLIPIRIASSGVAPTVWCNCRHPKFIGTVGKARKAEECE